MSLRHGWFRKEFAAVALVMALAPFALHGGGYKIPDQSTRAMGMIDAFVGGADDASAIYYNPAGLTHLTGPQLISNLYFAHGIMYYDGAAGSDRSDGRIYVVPNFYIATPLEQCPNIFLGLGIYSPFGLGSKWGDDSHVRYNSTLSEIELININPTMAVKLTDRLSVGAGINYFMSRAKLRNKSDYSMFGLPDGETDFDAEGDGWGYNLGLQYRLHPDVTIGLTYRSQVIVDYDGDVQFDGVPFAPPFTFDTRTDLKAGIEYPQMIAAGVMWQATEKLRLELAAEWQNWSTRKTQTFDMGMLGTVAQRVDWEDSWLIMLGGEYDFSEKWTLRAGYGYNETPVPRESADPSLPTGDTHAVSLGAGYKFSENVTFDIAGIFAYGEKRTLNNPLNPPGDNEYEAISLFLSFGVTYNF